MSTARARRREPADLSKGHPFRNVLIVSLIVAALVLWQLTPVIHGLNSVGIFLGHAQGVRRIIAGLLSVGYHRAEQWVVPLIHRIH